MYSLQVTIAATGVNQPILPPAVVPSQSTHPFQGLIPQNTGANNMRFGDATISTTKGLLLFPTGSVGNISNQLQFSGDLSEFYVNGTVGDTLDLMVIP
jgi:hypothetical protein